MLRSFEPDSEKARADAGFAVFDVVRDTQPRFKVAEIVE